MFIDLGSSMFEQLATNKMREYNQHAVNDWKHSYVATPNHNIHTHLQHLDSKNEKLSTRSQIQGDKGDQYNLIKKTATVRMIKLKITYITLYSRLSKCLTLNVKVLLAYYPKYANYQYCGICIHIPQYNNVSILFTPLGYLKD